jgi:hypothetical protein
MPTPIASEAHEGDFVLSGRMRCSRVRKPTRHRVVDLTHQGTSNSVEQSQARLTIGSPQSKALFRLAGNMSWKNDVKIMASSFMDAVKEKVQRMM